MDLRWVLRSCEEDPLPQRVRVQGSIPAWLQGGKVLAIGAGLFEIGNFKMNNLLDGYGVLISIYFNGTEEVTVQKQFLQSEAFKKATEASKPILTEFGTRGQPDPSKSLLTRFLSNFKPNVSDNCNHNICCNNGKIVAMTQTSAYRVIDPVTLETKDKIDLSKNGVFMLTPHPVLDRDGTLYNVGVGLKPTLKYVVLKTASSGETVDHDMNDTVTLTSVAPSAKTKFSLMHSFGLTENYVILVEHTMYVSGMKLLKLVTTGKAFQECLEWDPEMMTKFIVIEKRSGNRIQTSYLAPAFFSSHVINAFEDGDHVIIDLITVENEPFEDFAMARLTSGTYTSTAECSPKRFVLPLPNMTDNNISENLVNLNYTTAVAKRENDGSILCIPEILFDSTVHKACFENPSLNKEVCAGRFYRYFYGASGFLNGSSTAINSIIKADLEERRLTTWYAGKNNICGNALFIPSPDATVEDDGIIVAFVLSGDSSQLDFLVVVDGKSFSEIGRVEIPFHIPVMGHAIYLQENKM